MGCAQSKIDNEESVSRCKERRNFMKDAVTARNAFASGHSGYAIALKNTGAALSDYAQGEAQQQDPLVQLGGNDPPSIVSKPPPPPMMDQDHGLPPPPPPLPSFSPATPLQRSVTMPVFSKEVRKMESVENVEENEGEESGGLELRKRRNGGLRKEESSPRTPVAVAPPPPDAKGMAWDYFFNVENMHGQMEDVREEDEEEEDEFDERYGEHGIGNRNDDKNRESDMVGGKFSEMSEPKTPENAVKMEGFTTEEEETPVMVGLKEKQFMHSNTAPPDMRRMPGNYSKGGGSHSGVNLLKILGDIDDHFLKASECAQEVSKMLEATRLHYHSNFADNRGHIDHAARVMRVITWNKSFRGIPNGEGGKDNYDAEEYETHATVLDKLLAWEKKLYEEVKAGELMKLEYQRKVGQLNKLKKRGASSESLEKTKAAVSHLHTRYIVDMQSLDSTVSEVNHIRDDQLYPKLVVLVEETTKMWDSMNLHHQSQLKIVEDLKSLDLAGNPRETGGYTRETSRHHHERTIQLWNVVQEWHLQFDKLVTNQKQYIQALNSWLKLNLIPIESNLKEKVSSPPRTQNPPIQPLLISWHDLLEKLPDEIAKTAITSFSAVIKAIIVHQEEEMKLKEKCEETRKEYLRKSQAFEDWYQKYMQRRTPPDDFDPDRGVDTDPKDPIVERQFQVESLKKRLDEEVEAHQKHCVQVRDKSLGSLKIRLPELFRAMSDYTYSCMQGYENLRSMIGQSTRPNGSSQ
ncbi:protein ALTERED PHOSPHATE STARVATION RESPONSE 1-like [Apium graveolens]|uniref:protein ALTERED PHOSPHATE STARVATION RESPONSE 1-like n=1 Tax=Apium graveolens TaxID=4045 RepID=UPI003D7BFF3A